MVNATELNYLDYGKCIKLTNGKIYAIVTVDCGPRIIGFGIEGKDNVLNTESKELGVSTDKEYEDFFGKGKGWHSFGGHRIWASPEKWPDTYLPETDPVEYTLTENGGIFAPPPCIAAGLQTGFEIKFDDNGITVHNKITNISTKPMKFAVWVITVMRKGGIEIVPQNTNDTGLLANRNIAFWPYNEINDKRFYLSDKYMTLCQTDKKRAFKIGFNNNSGIGYYKTGNFVFKKSYTPDHENKEYPDGGMSYETYTNETILEAETIGEYKEVKANETSIHTEHWSIIETDLTFNPRNDDSIEKFLRAID